MPTDIDQSLSELGIIFQKMVMDMLGLLTGSPIDYTSAAYFVRISWPTEGAPAWKSTEDVVFLRITEEDDPINRQREVGIEDASDTTLDEATSYTRVVGLYLVFYGPNSFANAQTVRDGVFKDRYRWELAKDKIYLIPDIVAPRRIPEAFQSKYWERVDLEMRFNEKVVKYDEINIIESAEILVYNEEGLVSDETADVITNP
jgi:hypothetical protein